MKKKPSRSTHNITTRHGGEQASPQGDQASDTTVRTEMIWTWGAIPYILMVWGVSRIMLTGVGVLARSWLGQQEQVSNVQRYFNIGTGDAWLDIWSAWDSRWYYPIADVGYLNAPVHHITVSGTNLTQSSWAFFPLYPWVTQLLAMVVGNTYIAFLIVSNVSILIGAWLFYKLVEQHRDSATARRAVLFLFLFPTAYVFSCLMTESLFFALSVGAWYSARQGNWLLAGVLGMGSAMTRTVGLFMAPLLALEYLRQRQWRLVRIRPDALWTGLVPVGLGVFMAFCYIMTGNPLKFKEVQDSWDIATTGANPLYTLYHSMERAWRGGFAVGIPLSLVYGTIAAVVGTGVLLWGRKQIGNLLCLWSLTLILLPLSAHTLTYSIPRYLVVIFPLYMILASMRTNSVAFVITVAVLILLQAATFALWTTGEVMAI